MPTRPQPLNQQPPPMRLRPDGYAAHSSLMRTIISSVGLLVGVLTVAFFINAFWLQSYYVDGTSMMPTLHNHDRLIIDKSGPTIAHITGNAQNPKRGDIVIVDTQLRDMTGQYEQLIKRVVGLPGERLLVSGGAVTIYNHDHTAGFNPDQELGLNLAPTFTQSPLDTQIGKDEVFVMGDNRAPGGSLDSRAFGPVKLTALEGRLWARVFPFGHPVFF